ncbi:MAG: hypothetical protein ABFS86_07725 [Planctomycetota bacterium]
MRPTCLLLLLLLPACINVSSERTGPEFPPLPDDAPVLVYYMEESPLFVRRETEFRYDIVPATEIARLDVTYGKDRHWREVVAELREEARDLGGDIVRIGKGENGLSKRNFEAFVYRSQPE